MLQRLTRLIHRGPELYGGLIAAVFLAGIGFLPQFGGPGYEAALAAGVVLPSITAIATALHVARARPRPFDAFGRGLLTGTAFGALGLVLSLAHGLRVGFCDPLEGMTLYALGPWFGAALGGGWGALSALATERLGRPRARTVATVVLAVLGPLGGIAVSLWRFYTSPMVFAFDPFFGYFSGPLYDTVIDAIGSLATYRLGSAGSLLFASGLLLHLEREDGRLRWRWLGRPGLVLCSLLALALSVGVTLSGPRLGHYSTQASIERALGRSLAGKRCDVVYSRGVLERDAKLAAADCDAHVSRIERFFEITGPARIRLYLFANDAEKGRLMGASNTYIAKPWRREVYLQHAAYPHPVLGHEIAHVVAGSFGVGPFSVAGPLRGIIPDPGRIEGVAVAASPNENDDFLLEEWAKALLELRLLPSLRGIFRLGFLSENSSTAYTVAGAFVSWFKDRYGAAALRDWYAGAELTALTGKDLEALERDWQAFLRARPIDPKMLATARARFDRPAIFGRVCPRVVDRLAQTAGARLGAADPEGAREAYEEILALDPRHTGARFGLAACALRARNEALAAQKYEALSKSPELGRLEQAAALEARGDIALSAGRTEEARAAYDAVAQVVVDEDRLRTLDVKRFAAEHEPSRRAIVALLVGDPVLGPSWDVAGPRLAEWSRAEPELGLADYLLGKNLYAKGRHAEAAEHLDRALARQIPLPRVAREARRMRVVTGCALGDRAAAERAYAELIADPALIPARRRGLSGLAARCGLGHAEALKSPAH